MSNLLVVAHLSSPLAGDPPFLDALMETLLAAKHQVAHKCDRAWPAPPVGGFPIPIERVEIAGHVINRSSAPIMSEVIDERVEHYAKRFAFEHAALLHEQQRTIIPVGNQTLKSYRLPLQVRTVDRVAWFCVGEAYQVRYWCKRLISIGRKRAHGYGRVAKWEVTTVERDASVIIDDVLMRPLPAGAMYDGLQGAQRAFGACQPPYWHGDRMMEIITPC